jgi:hypothetical protein
MIIQHLKYPFYHTIIYNYFEKIEITKITEEINSLEDKCLDLQDDHHRDLFNRSNSESYNMDALFNQRRENSETLTSLRKVFDLKLETYVDKNPILGYLPTTNADVTYVQKYRNGSFYPPHVDGSVLTFLYPIHLQEFSGGELLFPKYDYSPHLEHNCLLIFPSYQIHKLGEIKSKHDGYVRYSINQRYYIGL